MRFLFVQLFFCCSLKNIIVKNEPYYFICAVTFLSKQQSGTEDPGVMDWKIESIQDTALISTTINEVVTLDEIKTISDEVYKEAKLRRG